MSGVRAAMDPALPCMPVYSFSASSSHCLVKSWKYIEAIFDLPHTAYEPFDNICRKCEEKRTKNGAARIAHEERCKWKSRTLTMQRNCGGKSVSWNGCGVGDDIYERMAGVWVSPCGGRFGHGMNVWGEALGGRNGMFLADVRDVCQCASG